jgi:outer membrane protein TolC
MITKTMNHHWQKKGGLLVLAFINCWMLRGQGKEEINLSLQDCIHTAIEKNINTIKARLDEESSRQKVTEVRSNLLPQLSGSGRVLDNIQIPLTMVPGALFGRENDFALALGSHYNTSVALSLNQVLYNQTALTGLELSKTSVQLQRLGVEKASENLAIDLAKLYFLAQTTAKQQTLVAENIERIRKMSDIIKLLADKGMVKQVDYDRISVTLENMHTQLSNTEALHEQQLNLMKYMLDIPGDKAIVLTDTLNRFLLEKNPDYTADFSSHIDIQLYEKQTQIAHLNQKLINAEYLPSFALFGQLAYQGISNHFKGYLENRATWSGASFIGINLSIPIFDGWQKHSKLRQAKIQYDKAELTLNNTKERFSVDYKNAVNNYYNNQVNVERQEKNIRLAEKVFAETTLKYKEGMVGMSDILQDEMGLSNAQMNYLNALYKFKEAELEIMALTGEIGGLIKN